MQIEKKAGEIMLSRKIDIWLKSSNHYQKKVEMDNKGFPALFN